MAIESGIGGLLKGAGGLGMVSQLNPVTAAISAVPALFQAGLGISQAIKGSKLAKSQVRPTLGMMPAQQLALSNAQNMAYGVAPGTRMLMDQLAQTQAGSIAGVQASGGGGAERMATLAMIDRNAGDQARQVGANQEDWQSRMMMNYQDQLMRAEQSQKDQWLYNKDAPYKEAMAAANELRDASNKNIFGSLTSLGGSAASVLGQKQNPPVIGTGTRSVGAGSPSGLGGIQPEKPVDPTNSNRLANMGPQGEGPQNAMQVPGTIPSQILTPETDTNYQIPQIPKGPFPTGYNPTTRETAPVVGPNNYNPSPAAPSGPFPAGYGGNTRSSAVNPRVLGAAYNNIMRTVRGY